MTFSQNCPDRSVLLQLINAAQAEKARLLAQEASGDVPGDGDDDDLDDEGERDADEMEEIPIALPVRAIQ